MISVSCRVRPALNTDTGAECLQIDAEKNSVTLLQKLPQTFKFDRVFDCNSSQESIFEECVPILQSVVSGTNGTIFAYGATCCGKTFTLAGPDYTGGLRGIVSRSIEWIFRDLSSKESKTNRYSVSISFLEIYLERVRDLLNPSSENLQLCDGEAVAPDAFEIQVTSVSEVINIIEEANLLKVMAPNKINQQSSRSHCVLQLFVRQKTPQGERKSSLFLADLAGSEKVNKTEAQGLRLDEAKNINKSLLALGKVVNALVTRVPTAHIPYRDSKLTRMLQKSLGGNCRTLIIVHLAPTDDYLQESLYTLLFAQRAKFVRNEAQQNRFVKEVTEASPYAASSEMLKMRAILRRLWFGEKVDKQEVDSYVKRLTNEQFLRFAWTNDSFDEAEMRKLYEIQYDAIAQLPLEAGGQDKASEAVSTAVQVDGAETDYAGQNDLNLMKYRRESALLHAIVDNIDLDQEPEVDYSAMYEIKGITDVVALNDIEWISRQGYSQERHDECCYQLLLHAFMQGNAEFAERILDLLQNCAFLYETEQSPLVVLLESAMLFQSDPEEYCHIADRVVVLVGRAQCDPSCYAILASQPISESFTRAIVRELHKSGVAFYNEERSALYDVAATDVSTSVFSEILEIASDGGIDILLYRLIDVFFEAIQRFSPIFDILLNSPISSKLLHERLEGRSCVEQALECVNIRAFRELCDREPKLLTQVVLKQVFVSNIEELMLYSLQFDLDFEEAAETCALNNKAELFEIINDKQEIMYSADFLSMVFRYEVDGRIISTIRANARESFEAQIVSVIEGGTELPKELYECASALTDKIRGVTLAEYLYLKADCPQARVLVKFLAGKNPQKMHEFRLDMRRVKAAALGERRTDWLQWCKELVVE